MSDWKIGLSDEPGQHLLIADILTARLAWKRLSKSARAAVEAAHPDGLVTCHSATLRSLRAHGFVDGWSLTEAGKAVAKWNLK